MTFVWHARPTVTLVQLVDNYVNRIHGDIVALARRRAPQIARWMQTNAPWNDQTGNARRDLFSEVVEASRDLVVLLLSHGPDIYYGVYLEFKFAGRDSILAPALDHWAPILWRDVRALVRR
jgi:hypothetical protein